LENYLLNAPYISSVHPLEKLILKKLHQSGLNPKGAL